MGIGHKKVQNSQLFSCSFEIFVPFCGNFSTPLAFDVADCNAQKFSRSGSWHPDSLFVRICLYQMACRLLVSNGMQWLLRPVFRSRELHRKFGLKATLRLASV